MSLKDQANRSDFTYGIDTDFYGINVVWIIDYDHGRLSVTNNIENIVNFIHEENPELKDLPDPIHYVYRDSELQWDGWNHKEESFIGIGARDLQEAIQKIINKKNITTIK